MVKVSTIIVLLAPLIDAVNFESKEFKTIIIYL